MSVDDAANTLRFQPPGPSHEGVLAALERLAIAIAEADIDTDEVEGFQFDMKGPINLGGGVLGRRPAESLCIGFTDHGNGGTSCLVEWL